MNLGNCQTEQSEPFKMNKQQNTFYITTPIYYVNARPHLGHTYTTIACDTLARYHRLKNDDTYFLTGTDEHGDKIVETAAKFEKSAADYAEEISNLFRSTWQSLNITNDDFIRTTEQRHKKAVAEVFSRLHNAGHIYFSEYSGKYCVGCERYLTDKELTEDGKCNIHLTTPQTISEENYFFKMQEFLPRLKKHLLENPAFIQPDAFYKETLGLIDEMISQGQDLCVSRPKTRLEWGVELPFDNRFVSYVWVDALTNYISALDFPDGEKFSRYWPSAVHMIGKDILKPHAVFWSTMLLAAGIPLYRNLLVHGYWLGMGDLKMSKSLGNAVDPVSLFNQIGEDPLRYFLMREMNFGADARFTEETLQNRLNTDLANDLGNLVQRTLSMLKKYNAGPKEIRNGHPLIAEVTGLSASAGAEFHKEFGDFRFHRAIEAIFALVRELNRKLEEYKPWSMAKSDPDSVPVILNTVLKGVVFCLYYLRPVLPHVTVELLSTLKLPSEVPFMDSIDGFELTELQLESWPMLFARLDLTGESAEKK